MKKVPASDATRKRLEEVFSGEHIDPSQIVREATRLMIEQALEAEAAQAVGRRYYARGRTAGDAEAASTAPRASPNSMPRRCRG